MTSVLFILVLGVGPLSDPLEGVQLSGADREALPSGRSLVSVADLWFANAVGLEQGPGGIANFDASGVSAHGRSWTQQHWRLNGLEITDPARAGLPLFAVPFAAWDEARYLSLFTSAPGFHLQLHPPKASKLSVQLGTGDSLGGGTWLPRRLLDREPAVRAGAPVRRRSLHSPVEVLAQGAVGDEEGGVRVFAEHLLHQHRYLTLTPWDEAQRSTVLALATLPWARPLELLVGWQEESRSHAGAQLRWPEELTYGDRARALIGQVRLTPIATERVRFDLAVGVVGRWDNERPNSKTPRVTDIEGEWLYLGRPRFAEDLARQRLSASAVLAVGPKHKAVTLSAEASHATVTSLAHIVGGRTAVTYDGVVDGEGTPLGLRQTVYDPAQRAEEYLRSLRLSLAAQPQLGKGHLKAELAYDYALVGTPDGVELNQPALAAGVAARWPLWGGEVFALARSEPESLTSEVASFVDPKRPSGRTYVWSDDGDLLPEAGETGQLLSRTGGRYHGVSANLARPRSNHFAFGIATRTFGPFRAMVAGVGRWLSDRYVVRLFAPGETAFVPTTIHDPGGDGRGEARAQGGGQELTAYARDPQSFGTDLYVLDNAHRNDFYLGLEMQLLTVLQRWWFVNFGGAAYLSEGGAPFGSFADRNDPGIVDEASADPNQRVLQRGRYDHDRSFALNLLAGVMPWHDVLASIALRYRDGEPFTRVVVAEGLPQGPTALMAVARGKPRHTFHMEMALRFAYGFRWVHQRARVLLDVQNVLGSGTELLEDPRTGPTFRRAVEMVPGRSAFVTLQLDWL